MDVVDNFLYISYELTLTETWTLDGATVRLTKMAAALQQFQLQVCSVKNKGQSRSSGRTLVTHTPKVKAEYEVKGQIKTQIFQNIIQYNSMK